MRLQRLQTSDFDVTGIYHRNDETGEAGWHVQLIDVQQGRSHSYWVSQGEFQKVNFIGVGAYPGEPVTIALGGPCEVDAKAKDFVLRAIETWEQTPEIRS